jgi:hypothetical protein
MVLFHRLNPAASLINIGASLTADREALHLNSGAKINQEKKKSKGIIVNGKWMQNIHN